MLARVTHRDLVRELWRIGEPYQDKPIQALEVRPLAKTTEKGGGFPPFANAREAWNPNSLTLAVGEAILAALRQAGLINHSAPIHIGERAGGYVRVFLDDADEQDNALFTESLHEALGPTTPTQISNSSRCRSNHRYVYFQPVTAHHRQIFSKTRARTGDATCGADRIGEE